MTDQLLAREAVVELEKELPGQPDRWPQSWPSTRAEFGALMGSFQDQLVGHALRRPGRFQDAEDVVKDVFVRAYARAGRGGNTCASTGVEPTAGCAFRLVLRSVMRQCRLAALEGESACRDHSGKTCSIPTPS